MGRKTRSFAASLAVALSAGMAAAPPAFARFGYRLTIAAAPNPDVNGDPVTIAGQLIGNRRPTEGVRIVLMHRVPPHPYFTPVARTRTTADGRWEIARAEGVVVTDRDWYALALGPKGELLARSRIWHERAYAELTLQVSSPTVNTGEALTFSGTVQPYRPVRYVLIQRQNGEAANGWKTIGRAAVSAGGAFTFRHVFKRADSEGTVAFRAVLPRDRYFLRSASEPVTVTVSQAQNPQLTLQPSAPVVASGSPVTLSGALKPAPGQASEGVTVTLEGRTRGSRWQPLASTQSTAGGAFTFTLSPTYNTAYRVSAEGIRSATVYEGASFTVTAASNESTAAAGSVIEVSGQVQPAGPGQIVYLQLRDAAGRFQTIAVGFLNGSSAFTIDHRLRSAGTKTYRIYVPGNGRNVGAASAPFTVTVTPPTTAQQGEERFQGQEEPKAL